MPSTKDELKKNKIQPREEEKIIDIDLDDKDDDIEIVPGVHEEEDVAEEEDAILDDEEVNPFGDKCEE